MRKRLPLILITLIALAQAALAGAMPLNTLSLDFTRTLTEANREPETTAGTLHYDAKTERVVVEVMHPLRQIMIVAKNRLDIYYPKEKQAFRFIAKTPIPLPFIDAIRHATQPEHGLTALGYTLQRHDVRETTLYTYWHPPKEAKESLGTIILGSKEDRLVSVEVKNRKGQLIATSHYSEHTRIGLTDIPMNVTATTYNLDAGTEQHEQIHYSNPHLNSDTPDPMLTFTIPASIEVKEIQW